MYLYIFSPNYFPGSENHSRPQTEGAGGTGTLVYLSSKTRSSDQTSLSDMADGRTTAAALGTGRGSNPEAQCNEMME
jgi:hypothetical protein